MTNISLLVSISTKLALSSRNNWTSEHVSQEIYRNVTASLVKFVQSELSVVLICIFAVWTYRSLE